MSSRPARHCGRSPTGRTTTTATRPIFSTCRRSIPRRTRELDSSVERLQVMATGLAPDRYRLTCNLGQTPLRPTGRAGEFVGGVRYRAWQPEASALHPTIGVQGRPLTFDLVDTWMERHRLGGCPISRDASRWAQLRQRTRSTRSSPRAAKIVDLPHGPHARAGRGSPTSPPRPGVSVHAPDLRRGP